MLKLFHNKGILEAGCDEAGRGCLAGPVYAAAVIWPANLQNKDMTDSKALTHAKRMALRDFIRENAIAWSVAAVEVDEIDEINILQASIKAMHNALGLLKKKPEFVIVDGNYFHPFKEIQHKCFVGGDAKYVSIAAASILAKTYRDEHMLKLHKEYSHYNWQQNKGYATKEHREAIIKHGICLHHRKSFNLNFQTKMKF